MPGSNGVESIRQQLREHDQEHLLTFCMSPGILDERMHLYAADQLRPGPMALEAGEDIQPLLCTWEEALEMARRGEIRDAKTLVALLYYRQFRATGRESRPA